MGLKNDVMAIVLFTLCVSCCLLVGGSFQSDAEEVEGTNDSSNIVMGTVEKKDSAHELIITLFNDDGYWNEIKTMENTFRIEVAGTEKYYLTVYEESYDTPCFKVITKDDFNKNIELKTVDEPAWDTPNYKTALSKSNLKVVEGAIGDNGRHYSLTYLVDKENRLAKLEYLGYAEYSSSSRTIGLKNSFGSNIELTIKSIVIIDGIEYYVSHVDPTKRLFNTTSTLNLSLEFENSISLGEQVFTKEKFYKTIKKVKYPQPLSSLVFNHAVYSIGDNCFKNSNIKELKFEGGVYNIGDSVFKSDNIGEIDIRMPNGGEICDNAFKDCSGLKKFRLITDDPSGISIGSSIIGGIDAFRNTGADYAESALEEIELRNIKMDGDSSFGVGILCSKNIIVEYTEGFTGGRIEGSPISYSWNGVQILEKEVKQSFEQDFDSYSADGIKYRLISKKVNGNFVYLAQVESLGTITKERNDINVPETITYNNIQYTVIEVGTGEKGSRIIENEYRFDTVNKKFEDPLEYKLTLNGNISINDYAFSYYYTEKDEAGTRNYYTHAGLMEITINGSVESIGSYAFISSMIRNLGSSTTIRVIGDHAFQYSKIETMNLSKIESIGEYAFGSSCLSGILVINTDCQIGWKAFDSTKISQITLGSEVKLGNAVFGNCSNLSKATIYGDSIPESTFTSCIGLVDLSIVDGTAIGKSAFYGSGITEFDFTKVASIDTGAFQSSKLTSIEIPARVVLNGTGQFQNCTELISAKFALSRVPDNCFNGCTSLKVVELLADGTVIGKEAFNTSGIVKFAFDKVASIEAGAFGSTKLETLNTKNSSLDKDGGQFEGCTNLKNVTIAGNIPKYCFYGCTSLSSVTTSNAATIGESAFCCCSSLEKFDLSNVEAIGECAFMHSALKDASFSNTLKGIGSQAFAFTAIENITIPDSTAIGEKAFYHCENLKTVEFSGTRETICKSLFQGCIKLNKVIFPNGLKKIEAYAFEGCKSLNISNESLNVTREDVLNWSESAFKNSGSIVRLGIEKTGGYYEYLKISLITDGSPRSMSFITDVSGASDVKDKKDYVYTLPTELGGIYKDVLLNKAFTAVDIKDNPYFMAVDGVLYQKAANGLVLLRVPIYIEFYEIPSNVVEIGQGAFKGCSLEEIAIPSGVKRISESAFANCSDLKIVILNEGLESIGDAAFFGCNIEQVSIPKSVKTIGENAFASNKSLYFLNIPYDSSLKTIGKAAFSDGIYESVFLPIIDFESTKLIFSKTLKNVYLKYDMPAKIGNIFSSESQISFYLSIESDKTNYNFNKFGGCAKGTFANYYVVNEDGAVSPCSMSVDVGSNTIYFVSLLGDLNLKGSVSENTYTFSISAEGGYSYHDLKLICGDKEIEHKNGVFVVTADSDLFITVEEREVDSYYEVSFDSSGGSSVESIRIGAGRTMLDGQYPIPTKDCMEFEGWYITESVEFTEDTPVNENMRLTAHWIDSKPLVSFYAQMGTVNAYMGEKEVVNGTRIDPGSSISFTYRGVDCSEFVCWQISSGNETWTEDATSLTLNNVDKDVTVSVKERYYSLSDSVSSMIITDSPTIEEDSSVLWKTSFSIDRSTNPWTGHSSVPLIVDDFVYVRGSDKIYKIEVDTGFVEKTVDSVSMQEYYHYLGYAHGYIIDYSNGKVYNTDLDMKTQFDFTVSSVFFDDGSTYLYGDNTLYKYDPSLSDCEWKRALDRPIFGQYGTTSSVVVEGDYIYYINAVEKSDRTICSIRTDNGMSVNSITLNKIRGFNMDDGWLTCYDDTLYVTAYTVGLFNSKVDGKDEGYVISIPISKGSFGEPTYTPTASRANSQFVVYNDRGYVNAGSSLFVFDIDKSDRTKLTKAYSVFTGFSHGGIVLNTSDATENNNHEVLVYVIPYNPGSGLVIARDHAGQTSGDVVTKYVGTHQYNSQAVRSTSDGKLIWYTDTGNIYCIGTARLNDYYFFIEDSNGSMWYHATGSTAADALSSLGSDVVTLNPSKELATVGGKTLDGWKIWGLKPSGDAMPTSSSGYAWMSLNSLYDSAYNEIHYFAISKTAPSNGTKYVYADGDELKEYEFSWNIGNRSLIGKPMTQGSSENVVTIRFYDDGTEIEGTCLIGEKGSSLSGSFPSIYRSGWSGTWVDADGNPATFPTQFPSENTKYRIVWTQNSYTIAGEKKQVGSATYFEVSVTRASGEKDVAEPRLLLIAEYSNGVFTNVFSDALSFDSTGNASKSMDVGVSTENLLKVHVYLVSGKPLGAFESYGEYVCEVSS